jgi:two-component system NtrC family sensor kinase
VTRADDILDGVLAIYRAQLMANKVKLDAQLKSSRQIFILPGEIRQVFGNLISNALDAIGQDGGELRVRCFDSTDWRVNRKGVRIIFSDSGSGVEESLLTKIFDAFFTTKGLRGSGVGLWLSAEILAKHNGSIRLRTRTTGIYRGTLFSVFIPGHVSDIERC